ncbi:exo-beta-N-acetylmuramidase NamZ domain-containing protein [Paenibacillus sp. J2TS4]|uniref:exo-beta-N-acetylmuramidase NamZ family protein n=1 Tax=Paenibacillus sp. J2TS4 TaxID=2807194 RepID=UPI001B0E3DB0|nr:DUF1343 domain-containing protein [Paenibacillus sp. J2TS4]GIP34351.1 hypothetical protein J2TS4_35610 [Paenibacillus sp. J2TS4]
MSRIRVQTGADRLLEVERSFVEGKRIGLLTNPTGRTSSLESVIDVCARLQTAKLTALFACEHGIRGERQAGVLFEDETDEQYGIPVYSLYGKRRKPEAEMLAQVDAVVFDIQDLGVRFYTYLTTLIYTMAACAESGKEMIVLDRPNPLGGEVCEGGILREGYRSMVGGWPIPFRTGMTIGEFAALINAETDTPCRLQVVPMEGWHRGMEYTDTGLPWIMPSPNIPTLDSARVYPGTCLFEGTNLSEGRGTTRPFELIGAPWLDARQLAEIMNERNLPGVRFCPMYFTPTFSKHQGELCAGVQLFVTDRREFRSVTAGLHLLKEVQRLHPEKFEWLPPFKEGGKPFIDLLTGSDAVRTKLHEPSGLQELIAQWREEAAEWCERRKPFLIYGEG